VTALVVWTAVAGVAVALGAGAARADDPEWEALALLPAPGGIAAPDFTLANVDGRRVGLAALRGRAVFLNFPQQCLRSDRLSAYAQWSLPYQDTLRNELRHGLEVIGSGETHVGATAFAHGKGRHGVF